MAILMEIEVLQLIIKIIVKFNCIAYIDSKECGQLTIVTQSMKYENCDYGFIIELNNKQISIRRVDDWLFNFSSEDETLIEYYSQLHELIKDHVIYYELDKLIETQRDFIVDLIFYLKEQSNKPLFRKDEKKNLLFLLKILF